MLRRASPHGQIGTFGIHCAVTGPGLQLCDAVFVLRRGQITAEALLAVPPPDRFSIAITGGTGAYRNARGQATVEKVNDTDEAVTFHLIGAGEHD